MYTGLGDSICDLELLALHSKMKASLHTSFISSLSVLFRHFETRPSELTCRCATVVAGGPGISETSALESGVVQSAPS